MNTQNQPETAADSQKVGKEGFGARNTDAPKVNSTRADRQPMSTHEHIKLARKAYDALEFLNNKTWTPYRDTLLKMCVIEEKDHRGALPDFNQCHTADTASVTDAAKLFAVKRIAEYVGGYDKFPSGQQYLHTQTSCFYAAGLADEFGEEIRQAWKDAGINEYTLAYLDYTEVVKVKREHTESEQPLAR